MPIMACHYTLNHAALPSREEELRVRFGTQVVNDKTHVLIYPAAEAGFEPRYLRFMGGIVLKLSDGTVAQRIGQLVITGQRIIGLIVNGSVGEVKLDSSTGSAYAFALSLNEIQPLTIKTNWRNKPVSVNIRSKVGQDPAFLLQIFAVQVVIGNDGAITYTSLAELLRRLTPEGRQSLQQP